LWENLPPRFESSPGQNGLRFQCDITLRSSDFESIGDWKLKPTKSKLTDEMKVERLAANKYGFAFASDGVVETIGR
jgi:hypothetical protein